ncbi:hypothetical protein CKA32_005051 [Geitlerinema sp. FC II]|nr:hypothetical protein CKA32_005051 [Geitlerinema sp. FC II]
MRFGCQVIFISIFFFSVVLEAARSPSICRVGNAHRPLHLV